MTLTEILVTSGLMIVAMVMLWSLQQLLAGTQRSTSASYLVNGQTDSAIQRLRREINETALGSVLIETKDAPTVSFASARPFDREKKDEIVISPWGSPQWDKHVLYRLQTEPGAKTGQLIRWEKEFENKNFLPQRAPFFLPSSGGKVVLRDVLAPNQSIAGVGPAGKLESNEYGGFRVEFVRRAGNTDGEESLTRVNPSEGDSADNTRLLEVELKILQEDYRSPDSYSVVFRCSARH